jgi:hypothetical protein
MNFTLVYSSLALGLFFGMLGLLELGRRLGARRLAQDPDGIRMGAGAVEGAIFALLGLLIAFTFSGAASRFDTRRQLVVQEANAIGTAYLRLDLLPAATQPTLRDLFRRYLDSRLEVYRTLPDLAAAQEALGKSAKLQSQIWAQAVAACVAQSGAPATMLLVPALNEMIDITTTRTMAARIHPPMVIFGMLCALMLASALIAGYGMAGSKSRSWLHMFGFAATLALAVYVILDIEYPRSGLIRIDAIDRVLVDLRESMTE